MREIKFMAWDQESKSMHLPMSLQMMKDILVKGTIGEVGHMGAVFAFTFDELIFLQFTGLKDKNGKDIYEGDVIQYVIEENLNSVGDLVKDPITYTEEVHFENGGFELDGCPLSVANEIGEVIGNIYENPELCP